MKSEAEVAACKDKLTDCPLCEETQCENHERCFHCVRCGYLQCCDYDGFYEKGRERGKEAILKLLETQ